MISNRVLLIGVLAAALFTGTESADRCPKGSFHYSCTDTCLWYNKGRLSYKDAQRACQDKGGELATAEIETKDLFIKGIILEAQLTPRGIFTWLGGNSLREGRVWMLDGLDKSAITSYTGWEAGEPNHDLKDEDCLALANWESSNWHDVPCSWELPSMCEMRRE